MQFTPAETRVIEHMAMPQKIAAHRIGCSESAVKYHAQRIEKRLGVKNRASAVLRLSQMGHHIRAFQ